MEFKEFCKERSRMCEYYNGQCESNACPLYGIKNNNPYHRCDFGSLDEPDEAERIVSEWAKEHPVVTNADKFREVFGTDIHVMSPVIPANLTFFTIRDSGYDWLKQEYQQQRKENADDCNE